MAKNHIDFQGMDWESPAKGMKQKVHSDGIQKIRLVRFSEDFAEEEWCTKGHLGYVLDGEMTIDFNGVCNHYKKGDALWIPKGDSSKHKAIIEKGKQAELILFERED